MNVIIIDKEQNLFQFDTKNKKLAGKILTLSNFLQSSNLKEFMKSDFLS